MFNGHTSGPFTNDITHLRRIGTAVGAKVLFTDNTSFKSKKGIFQANSDNKQNFIYMLSKQLVEKGCSTIHASGDADVLIVKTTI